MFGLRLLSLWVLLFVSVVIMVLLVVYLFAVVTDLVWLFWFLWWVGGGCCLLRFYECACVCYLVVLLLVCRWFMVVWLRVVSGC